VVLASSSSVDGGAGDAGEDASNPRRADPPGARCELPSDCASGHCIGGLCCDSACDQPCASCALPGREGTCSPLPAGSADTLNRCADQGPESCGTNGKCDGQGNCARYGAETICRPGRCQSKTDMIAPSRCDGLGTCEAAAVVPCGPFICRDGGCTSSCQSAGDCAPDATCDAAGSCGKKGLGQPCDRGAQCASGFCVDGVCCANACAGPCRSCTSGAQPGMCKITAAGAGDPRQLCKTDPSASCGVNGTCDGQGNCALSPSGTVCAPASLLRGQRRPPPGVDVRWEGYLRARRRHQLWGLPLQRRRLLHRLRERRRLPGAQRVSDGRLRAGQAGCRLQDRRRMHERPLRRRRLLRLRGVRQLPGLQCARLAGELSGDRRRAARPREAMSDPAALQLRLRRDLRRRGGLPPLRRGNRLRGSQLQSLRAHRCSHLRREGRVRLPRER
jgi:hypothetical protein